MMLYRLVGGVDCGIYRAVDSVYVLGFRFLFILSYFTLIYS